MNVTDQVRELLITDDPRVIARVGADALFDQECDHCNDEATLLVEIVTSVRRGAIREGHIYCLDHGTTAVDTLTWASDADEIAVTIPASLLAAITLVDLAA
jgi:hypothetical protein